MSKPSLSILIVLDGWGFRDDSAENAIKNANTPQWDKWWGSCPHTLLDASGEAVGLPNKQMGNSEVGHMHIGAGRTILQNYSRINNAIHSGEFAKNDVLQKAVINAKSKNNSIHVFGLLSDGGVHSHQQHLFAFINICKQNNLKNLYLHLFLDGRDTPPKSAKNYLHQLEEFINQNNSNQQTIIKIASISGRYYAMDRDKRWDRIQKVYNLLVCDDTLAKFNEPLSAIEDYYKKEIYDEFIPPTKLTNYPLISDEDTIFFFNFRADRARELTEAFIKNEFQGFNREKTLKNLHFFTMTEYESDLNCCVVFPQVQLKNTLGEVISANDLKQLRIAETEKYAHVTFFLNGGGEVLFNKEERILVPSPKVATYDLVPEMSAHEVTTKIIDAIDNHKYDVIICNFANADMVGHTGNFSATIKAIESLDNCLAKIGNKIQEVHGQMLITADHGNAERMFDSKSNQPLTSHTSEPVPLLYVGPKKLKFKDSIGNLSDVAPTFLGLLNITAPAEMTGNNLLIEPRKSS
ncbi:MAG: phosphoglycerate mutase (2,3-diphosphoglycerate-independent) [Legionellales bacterium RIFCSPHIGHO2_12_FULL_35_11]|nr:MAG: phosphoglycerate mutase (2,3-diphosphoglycerate-independent) [Legionellales bacterium RIFCSPHIGHO2_12_FULL_35_11]